MKNNYRVPSDLDPVMGCMAGVVIGAIMFLCLATIGYGAVCCFTILADFARGKFQ